MAGACALNGQPEDPGLTENLNGPATSPGGLGQQTAGSAAPTGPAFAPPGQAGVMPPGAPAPVDPVTGVYVPGTPGAVPTPPVAAPPAGAPLPGVAGPAPPAAVQPPATPNEAADPAEAEQPAEEPLQPAPDAGAGDAAPQGAAVLVIDGGIEALARPDAGAPTMPETEVRGGP